MEDKLTRAYEKREGTTERKQDKELCCTCVLACYSSSLLPGFLFCLVKSLMPVFSIL